MNFISFFKKWIFSFGIINSVCIFIYVIISLGMGDRLVPASMILSFTALSLACTLIQLLCFSDVLFKRLRYSLRLIVFAVAFFITLSLTALLFRWFPTGEFNAWLFLTILFFVILAMVTAIFEIYYRFAGIKYDGLLGQYKETRRNKH